MALVSPSKLAHVVYRTRRFDEMINWYTTVFDARVQSRDEVLAFLTYDDEHHRFAFANLSLLNPVDPESAPDHEGTVGVDHVAYTHDSLDTLFDNYAQLKELDVMPYWCIHHGLTISMYYADPDGNQLEFQVECFTTLDEANDFMTSADFAANPVGVEYDPDEWLQERAAGTPLNSKLKREIHTPMSPLRGALS